MAAKPYKMLIIDNDPINVFALKQALRAEYAIFSENTGHDGIIVAKRELPDIILLGLELGDANGLDVLALLKADQEIMDIPVMVAVDRDVLLKDGQSEEQVEEQILFAGAVDIVHKPYNAAIVKLRMVNHLKIAAAGQNLFTLAHQDSETELASITHFNHVLVGEWRRAMRTTTPVTLIMFSIQNYQEINATPDGGKLALSALADVILKKFTGVGDIATRWSCSEIVVLVPNVSSDQWLINSSSILSVIDVCRTCDKDNILNKLYVRVGKHTTTPDKNYSLRRLFADVRDNLDKN